MKKCIWLTCRSIFSDRLRSKFRAINNNQALCVTDAYYFVYEIIWKEMNIPTSHFSM
jgi:hypothetical protein